MRGRQLDMWLHLRFFHRQELLTHCWFHGKMRNEEKAPLPALRDAVVLTPGCARASPEAAGTSMLPTQASQPASCSWDRLWALGARQGLQRTRLEAPDQSRPRLVPPPAPARSQQLPRLGGCRLCPAVQGLEMAQPRRGISQESKEVMEEEDLKMQGCAWTPTGRLKAAGPARPEEQAPTHVLLGSRTAAALLFHAYVKKYFLQEKSTSTKHHPSPIQYQVIYGHRYIYI